MNSLKNVQVLENSVNSFDPSNVNDLFNNSFSHNKHNGRNDVRISKAKTLGHSLEIINEKCNTTKGMLSPTRKKN